MMSFQHGVKNGLRTLFAGFLIMFMMTLATGCDEGDRPDFYSVPDCITIDPGDVFAVSIHGGRYPYASAMSDNNVVAMASLSGSTVNIQGRSEGTAKVRVEDGDENFLTITVNVNPGSIDYNDSDEDGDGFTENQGDCNDQDPAVHPDAEDICEDGIDQDCDGEDATCPLQPGDADEDQDGVTVFDGDCDDTNPDIYPGAEEICGDGIDQNCDGEDATCPLQPGDADEDQDGFTVPDGDCDDTNPDIYPGAEEICGDGIDQDCDGTDEACASNPNNEDDDGDGFTENGGDCNDADPTIYPGAEEICEDGIDQDCNMTDLRCPENTDYDGDGYTPAQGDCDDDNTTVNPEAQEICEDGIDQDCDGEDSICPGNRDMDEDGFTKNEGDCNDEDPGIHPDAEEICEDGIDQDCDGEDPACPNAPDVDDDEDGFTENEGDCNDEDPGIHPDAEEICEDGIDQDCDGDDAPCGSDPDMDDDGDGFTENEGDCDDENPSVYPGATEICSDGIDQNCDGEDMICPQLLDFDEDGFTELEGDCNDLNASVYPGAEEICGDGIDQDCDGDDLPCDGDEDMDQDGFSFNEGDCDDDDPDIHPDAEDICGDGIDQDCDGEDASCQMMTGVFIDARVDGLEYASPTQSGLTNPEGEFDYLENETLTFSIGDIVLGSAAGAKYITPVDLVQNAVDENDPQVVNLLRFIQTMDDDCYYENGIRINEQLRQKASTIGHSLNFDQSVEDFEQDPDVIAVVEMLTALTCSGERGLVPAEEALNHFRQVLPMVDMDKDGFAEEDGDCNDKDPGIFPGAQDICGDGVDQDCSGADQVCQ